MQFKGIVERILFFSDTIPAHIPFAGYDYNHLGKLICGISKNILGERVAIICPQGPAAYISMLAVLHSGATYVPININTPMDRQLDILYSFSPTDIIYASGEIKERYRNMSFGRSVNILSFSDLKPSDIVPPVPSTKPAYVIFTSGSTGKPKGVTISRSAMNSFVNWGVSALNLHVNSRVSQHPNIAFDLSVLDIFVTLCSGATLFPITTKYDRLMPAKFIKLNKITHWVSVPSVVDLMIKDKSIIKETLRELKLMVFCGEPLLKRHLEFIFNINPNITVLNTYGPTEATVCMTQLYLNASNWRNFCEKGVAIGEAIDGMEYELIGGSDSTEGEIFIKGIQVADGYWNSPDITKAFFKDGGYYTGDWAKKRNGQTYFEARIDRQIKVNGFRVELGEIEEIISGYVDGAVACVYTDGSIKALIEDKAADLVLLRDEIIQKLPEYMVPNKIEFTENLPRNINDKIDYNRVESQLRESNEI